MTDLRSLDPGQVRKLEPGSRHYRAFVGHPKQYDVTGAKQFALMASLGLREYHRLLDIGCGSLCGGRLFIPYLLPENYCGVDPEEWLIKDAIRHEVSIELEKIKKPRFLISANFDFTNFDERFDFIVSQSVLTHVSMDQLDRCLAQVVKVLEDDGLFAASFFFNGQDHFHSGEWAYPAFSSFSPKYVIETAKKHGLKGLPLPIHSNYGHYWLVFTHSANAKKLAWIGDPQDQHPMFQILELKRLLASARAKLRKAKKHARQSGLVQRKARRTTR